MDHRTDGMSRREHDDRMEEGTAKAGQHHSSQPRTDEHAGKAESMIAMLADRMRASDAKR